MLPPMSMKTNATDSQPASQPASQPQSFFRQISLAKLLDGSEKNRLRM